MTIEDRRGFSLIEVMVAVSLLALGVSAVAQLALASARAQRAASDATLVQVLAGARLEQLRGLAWTSDAGIVPISDWSTDLSLTPASPAGGPGLGVSPAGALLSNIDGYCDFLDARGTWLAGGTRPPVGTAWIRRWSIDLPGSLSDTLRLQVLVVPLERAAADRVVAAASTMNGAWLVALRSRRMR
ncbi:MAG: prepilin-type N-terminal cleavage/methylation domain-containing protein [Vicinamibacterales bacterium]